MRQNSLTSVTEQPIYGVDDAPPDWDQNPTGGVWEINVAPQPPVVPQQLPVWAQQAQQAYEENEFGGYPRGGTSPYGRVPSSQPAARPPPSRMSCARPVASPFANPFGGGAGGGAARSAGATDGMRSPQFVSAQL